MITIICGKIDKDDIMSYCIENKLFSQLEQFELGYNVKNLNMSMIHTNNDHFFNGIRVAIKENNMNIDDVIFQFNYYDNDIWLDVYIDKYGHADYWPEGFFDQWEKALIRIID